MGEVCRTTYNVPEDIDQLVSLLNQRHKGSVTVTYGDGGIIGEWADDPIVQVKPMDFILVYTGDQLMFKADTVLEAKAFLQGILIAVENWKD